MGLSIQEMHEQVYEKQTAQHGQGVVIRLWLHQNRMKQWRAAWTGTSMASGVTAQDAINAAFKLAMGEPS